MNKRRLERLAGLARGVALAAVSVGSAAANADIAPPRTHSAPPVTPKARPDAGTPVEPQVIHVNTPPATPAKSPNRKR